MIPEIENLDQSEKDLLYKAPILVTVLIAGADDLIDSKEKESAVLSAKFNYQTLISEPKLEEFYETVTEDFLGKLTAVVNELPPEAAIRNPIISAELMKLNEILPKLDAEFAILYYDSLKALSVKVAEASGGFLGLGSVSSEEQEWVELSMISAP
ncbi:hypothetical protein JYU23_01030 [bacterium AH-315-C07]|nr:hypothetical protein [bacterium AH-315-C07]